MKSWICSQVGGTWWVFWGLTTWAWRLMRRQSCGTEPLACEIWCCVQVESIRTELSCRTLTWHHGELFGEKTHTHLESRRVRSEVFHVNGGKRRKVWVCFPNMDKLPALTDKQKVGNGWRWVDLWDFTHGKLTVTRGSSSNMQRVWRALLPSSNKRSWTNWSPWLSLGLSENWGHGANHRPTIWRDRQVHDPTETQVAGAEATGATVAGDTEMVILRGCWTLKVD